MLVWLLRGADVEVNPVLCAGILHEWRAA
jgi:hypothetical protein